MSPGLPPLVVAVIPLDEVGVDPSPALAEAGQGAGPAGSDQGAGQDLGEVSRRAAARPGWRRSARLARSGGCRSGRCAGRRSTRRSRRAWPGRLRGGRRGSWQGASTLRSRRVGRRSLEPHREFAIELDPPSEDFHRGVPAVDGDHTAAGVGAGPAKVDAGHRRLRGEPAVPEIVGEDLALEDVATGQADVPLDVGRARAPRRRSPRRAGSSSTARSTPAPAVADLASLRLSHVPSSKV